MYIFICMLFFLSIFDSSNKASLMNKETKQIIKDLERFAKVMQSAYVANKVKELKQSLKTQTK